MDRGSGPELGVVDVGDTFGVQLARDGSDAKTIDCDLENALDDSDLLFDPKECLAIRRQLQPCRTKAGRLLFASNRGRAFLVNCVPYPFAYLFRFFVVADHVNDGVEDGLWLVDVVLGEDHFRLSSDHPDAGFEDGCTGEIRASGGTRTHTLRLTRAAPNPSSIAGNALTTNHYPLTKVTDGIRTHVTWFTARPLLASRVRSQYPRQESNLHDLRLRRAACLRHTPGKFILPLAA